MNPVIDKVKYKKGRTTIVHHTGPMDDPEDSDSKTSKSPPTDEFKKALQDLKTDLLEICELEDDHPVEIIGVSFSYPKDVMGVTITGLRTLDTSVAPLILNTPFKTAEPLNEGGDTNEAGFLSDVTVKRLKKVIEEAINYLGGARGTKQEVTERKSQKEIMKEVG